MLVPVAREKVVKPAPPAAVVMVKFGSVAVLAKVIAKFLASVAVIVLPLVAS